MSSEVSPCEDRDGQISVQQLPDENPKLQNPSPPIISDSQTQEWETRARAWLSTLPMSRNIMPSQIDAWLDSNYSSLPEEIKSLTQSVLHNRMLDIHKSLRRLNQVGPPQARFQRTDQWIPVYSWLESLNTNEVVKSKEIADWLSENPRVKDQLYSRHSRYHLMHYIQKCHLKMLRRREKLKKGAPLRTARIPIQVRNNRMTTLEVPLPCKFSSDLLEDNSISSTRKNEAFLRFDLLTDLQNQLTNLLSRQRQENTHQLSVASEKEGNIRIESGGASHFQDA
ncbi:ribonucleoside-diphosphate reductase subunit beta [Tasmannia lanceolata]|uniref:ribonucleoside-diphosphate reductase subunit beta n=1 Tax=Tasmannia lanceolata TaxID=3420 RepID=UPI00406331E4